MNTKTKKTKTEKKPKYKKGDIVGVCGDAMYEFKILYWSKKQKVYAAQCTHSYTKTIKVGDKYGLPEKRILVKLGDKGKKWPPPEVVKKKRP